MLPHQQRVIDEKEALDDKIKKLTGFIIGDTFDSLPQEDKMLLSEQKVAMEIYYNLLKRRIARFT